MQQQHQERQHQYQYQYSEEYDEYALKSQQTRRGRRGQNKTRTVASVHIGKGIRRAIHEERWNNVRSMLDQEEVQKWFPTKWYNTVVSAPTAYNGTDASANGQQKEKVMALHLILQYNVPLDIVETIIELEPQLLRFQSSPTGNLPLHVAIQMGRRKEIIDLLVRYYPAAVAVPNEFGQTPLHIACQTKRSIKIIEGLYQCNPHAALMEDSYGYTPYEALKESTFRIRVGYRREAKNILHGDRKNYGGMVKIGKDAFFEAEDDGEDTTTSSTVAMSSISETENGEEEFEEEEDEERNIYESKSEKKSARTIMMDLEMALRRVPPIPLSRIVSTLERQVLPYRHHRRKERREQRRRMSSGNGRTDQVGDEESQHQQEQQPSQPQLQPEQQQQQPPRGFRLRRAKYQHDYYNGNDDNDDVDDDTTISSSGINQYFCGGDHDDDNDELFESKFKFLKVMKSTTTMVASKTVAAAASVAAATTGTAPFFGAMPLVPTPKQQQQQQQQDNDYRSSNPSTFLVYAVALTASFFWTVVDETSV